MSLESEIPAGPWGAQPQESASASVPEGPLAHPVVFMGQRRSFARLMAAGYALYLPSFGFNRFWLKTDERRFFWLNTTVDGDSFDYRGTARELVIGFLFAVAIYMPIAAAYSIAGLYAETVQTYASLPFFIFTFAFGHFAAFRARRYRLTRTAFRGIRFWMSGSGWKMGFAAFGWMLLTALTFGIAYFWMQAWLERYKMRHSSYGNVSGRFEGTGWGLIKAYFWPALLLFCAIIAFLVLGFSAISGMFVTGSVGGATTGFALFLALMLFVGSATWSVISVIKTRWWLNGVCFGDCRLHCTIKANAMVKPALKTALVVMLALSLWFLLGAAMVGGVRAAARGVYEGNLLSDLWTMVPIIIWAMAGLVIAMAIKAILYNFDFVQKIAASTTITGLETLVHATALGTAEGAVGEGLADALGADGF